MTSVSATALDKVDRLNIIGYCELVLGLFDIFNNRPFDNNAARSFLIDVRKIIGCDFASLELLNTGQGSRKSTILLHGPADVPAFLVKNEDSKSPNCENYYPKLLEEIAQIIVESGVERSRCRFTDKGAFWVNDSSKFCELAHLPGFKPGNERLKENLNINSFAIIPVRAGGDIIGSLRLFDNGKRTFSAEIIDFAERICRLLGQYVKIADKTDTRVMSPENPAERPGFLPDISPKSLALSEEKFRKAFLASPDSITISRIDTGQIVDVNDAFVEYTGHSREQAIGKTSLELGIWKNPSDRDELKEILRLAGSIRNFEHIALLKNGAERICEVSGDIINVGGDRYLLTMTRDITDYKNAQSRIIDYQRRLYLLANQISAVEDRERRELAENLHDGVGQNLAICKMKLQALAGDMKNSEIIEHLNESVALIDTIITATRSLIFELSPPVLYDLGFVQALDWLAEKYGKSHGITVLVAVDDQEKPLDDITGSILFRASRELLMNVIKHANADSVEISVNRVNDKIKVCIKDNGTGFKPDTRDPEVSSHRGFGLFNIRERLKSLGGSIEVYSKRGSGSAVTLIAPLGPDSGNRGRSGAYEYQNNDRR